MRRLSPIDSLLTGIDAGLRTVFAATHAQRPMPSAEAGESLAVEERELSVRLMRVNHTGEVCAQALYQGQAAVAREPQTRRLLVQAGAEERDHLAWCARRLDQLGGATSRLNPAFYAGSFMLGAVSGLLRDKWSLGFLVETERQVEAHLAGHLEQLSPRDRASRAVVAAMRNDEITHGNNALAAGAAELPTLVKRSMRLASTVMTRSTYWV